MPNGGSSDTVAEQPAGSTAEHTANGSAEPSLSAEQQDAASLALQPADVQRLRKDLRLPAARVSILAHLSVQDCSAAILYEICWLTV